MKRILFLLGCSVLLVSCSQYTEILPSKPTNIPTKLFVPTETLTVTSTATITPTFTETRTTTETAIPRPVYREDFPITPDDFILTTEEGKKAIIQDIIDHPTLPEPQESYFAPPNDPISVFSDQDLFYLFIRCKMGQACAWRGWLKEVDSVNGPDRYFGELEVRNKGDKNSHILDLYLNDNEKDTLRRFQSELDDLATDTGAKGDVSYFRIPILSRHWNRWQNPVLAEIIDGITPARRKELQMLQNARKIFDSISDAPLWLARTFRTA